MESETREIHFHVFLGGFSPLFSNNGLSFFLVLLLKC